MESGMNVATGVCCPVCSAAEPEVLQTVEKAPAACGTLYPSRDAAAQAEECRLNFVLCTGCGHIWNAEHGNNAATSYDEGYYSSKTGSEQARSYQMGLAQDLDNLVGLSGKTVVEIGCGDGFFLQQLSGLGAESVGFEPSATFSLARDRGGIKVYNQNFPFEGNHGAGSGADMVVMRHVLEHLGSPLDVLRSLRTRSFGEPGPQYLFLEVPNVSKILEDNLYFDFFNDHVHYFSHASLSDALRRTGWRPLERLGEDDEFLRVLAVNAGHQRVEPEPPDRHAWAGERDEVVAAAIGFRQQFDSWKCALANLLNDPANRAGGTAAWGAGSRGVAMLAGLGMPKETFSYVVDSDANKNGRFLPVVHLPVYPPARLLQDPVAGVLVTSYTYFDEILAQLDGFRAAGGKVIKAFPAPEVMD